jgi:hypothetical protein
VIQTYYRGGNAAAVKKVALDHDAGVTLRRRRTGRRPEIEPIDLALGNLSHQRSSMVARNFVFISFA